MAVADQDGGHEIVQRVVDAVLPKHPDWAARACRHQFDRIADAGKSQYYHEAAAWLARAGGAFRAAGREDEWRRTLEEALQTHSRKRNLLPLWVQKDVGKTSLFGGGGYEINPVTGLAYKIIPDLTAYFGYSQSNRAPTPLEQACSSATKPCLLENFLVADPPLNQVTARSIEAGLRGSANVMPLASIRWHFAVFRSDLHNDIHFVASPIVGRGFFENVGSTRRQGAEFELNAAAEFWSFSFDYGYTDATFRSALILNSPDNPLADDNGQITVRAGDHLSGIPAHIVKAVMGVRPTQGLEVTFAMRAASGAWLRGRYPMETSRTVG